MSSEIKADKWSPASGTAGTIGDSGDTFTLTAGANLTLGGASTTVTVPSGATLDVASGATLDTTGATVTGVTGANLVKITSGSVSSGAGEIALTGVFTSTYKIYKIFLYDWNTSIDAAPYLRWYTGTNTEQSSTDTYSYAGVGFNTDGQGSSWSGTDNQIQITGETIRHDTDEQFAWEGTLYNPAGTTLKKRLVMAGGGRRTGNYGFNGHGTGEWSGTTAITGVKVWPSGGTFDSLSYAVYGLVT